MPNEPKPDAPEPDAPIDTDLDPVIEAGADAAPDADAPIDTVAADKAAAANRRADAYRERFRHSQLIAAQVAKARAAGGQPSETEAARLIAEFHARGGQVTVVPQAEEPTLSEQDARKPARRVSG